MKRVVIVMLSALLLPATCFAANTMRDGYWEVVTLAHQVFSGISYSKEHAASYHTRASRSLYSFLGEPAYHRQKLARLLTT